MAANEYAEIGRMSPFPQQSVFRILCIDDHEDTNLLLQTFLERTLRYEVIAAVTGAQGLEMAISQPLDLIMLDAWLPDMSGVELCREIRRFNQVTPILFYSAAAYSSDIETGLAAGAQAYIVKPADLDELELTIRRLIEGTSDTVQG